MNIILNGIKKNLHVLSLWNWLSNILIRFECWLDLAFSTIQLIACLTLFAVYVPAILQPDTLLNDFDTIVAGEGIEQGLEWELEVSNGVLNEGNLFFYLLSLILPLEPE